MQKRCIMTTEPLSWLPLSFARLWFAALLMILIGCSRDAEKKPGNEDVASVKSQVFVFVFDPTVFEPDHRNELNRWLDRFEDFYRKIIPQDSRVAIFVIGEAMAQATAEEKVFEFDPGINGGKQHAQALESHSKEVRQFLTSAWEIAHGEEQVRKPTSCILSSLLAVQRYLDRFSQAEGEFEFSLVILSDMIESCTDWGGLISLERGIAGLGRLGEVQSEIDLARLSSVVVIQLPSRFGTTPLENQQIHSFWQSLLQEKGIPKERLFYLTDFPVGSSSATPTAM